MNERFKFRVFDFRKEVYLNIDKIFLNADGVAYYFDSLCNRFNLIQYDVVVEQCTGLRDKNNNLIYEGDILRFANMIDVCVLFRDGGFIYSLTEDEKIAYRLTEVIAKETEIIGNIHKV